MHRILVVEDDHSIRDFLKINFQRNGFKVLEADSGEEALNISILESPDIVILDIMLPGIDGFKVCQELRMKYPLIGIIMLTARSKDFDKITAFEYGADDYIVKPFNPLELTLRVKALTRRIDNIEADKSKDIIEAGPFKIDMYSQKLFRNNKELELTPKEYAIMKTFMENPGRAFSRDEILNIVWGYNFIGDSKIVDVNIRRLRSKIEDNPSSPKYIETIWGTGYRWRR